jgi:hypothetical protein
MKIAGMAMGLMVVSAPLSLGQTFEFDTPSDDRWHYPFNFTPGIRARGSCFGAPGIPDFNDRDGEVVLAWDTSGLIAPGQGASSYSVESVIVTVTNPAEADWEIDLTTDEWFTFDIDQDGLVNADGIARGEPGDVDGESDDGDTGRPIEMFGAGFGPTYTAASWVETSSYIGSGGSGDAARDPFPFVYQEGTFNILHVEDSVKGLHNAGVVPAVLEFTPTAWAIGEPVSYTPESQVTAFEIEMEVDLSLSGEKVREYFQDQLNAGRVSVIVTSMVEVPQQAASGFPVIFMKEDTFDPEAVAAKLTIVLSECVPADVDCDGDVDGVDFSVFAACFNKAGNPPRTLGCPSEAAEALDFENDGDVDGVDFSVFAACFNKAGNPPRTLGCPQN